MLKPIFSLSFSLDQDNQKIFQSWLKSEFWQKSWYGKSQFFRLPAVSNQVQGTIRLQPLLPQYTLTVTQVQPGKSLEFLFSSRRHSFALTYSLTGSEPTVLNITAARTEQIRFNSAILNWLAKPYLIQHAEKVAALCRSLPTPLPAANTKTPEEKKADHTLPTMGFFLWRLANTWQQQVDRALKEYNLTSTQWLLLFNLLKLTETGQNATISSLASKLDLNEVHVSDVVTSLVKKHYVHKIKLPSDKRKFQLTATPEGKIAAAQANTSLIQAERKFFQILPNQQKQQLANLITQLAIPLN